MDFRGSFRASLFQRVTFRNCRFLAQDLSAAMLDEVRFEHCSFERCRFVQTVFQSCTFESCQLREGPVREPRFVRCTMRDCLLEGMIVYNALFDELQVVGGTWTSIRLSECELRGVSFEGSTLESIRFTLCRAAELQLVRCAMRHVTLLGGNYGNVLLQEGSLSDLTVAEAQVDTLRCADIPEADQLRINKSKVQKVALERCAVTDGYLYASELENLTIANGSYRGAITECRVGPGSHVLGSVLIATFWDETHATGLTFSRVSFQRFLCATKARFVNTRIEQPNYAPGFELVLNDAQFENSDTFSIPSEG